jgi:hypothetical protein
MGIFPIYRPFSTKYYRCYQIGEDEMGRPTARAQKLYVRNPDERDR